MSVSYSAATKTARLQVAADLISSKTLASATGAGAAGSLVIGTSALSGSTGVLATIPLPVNGLSVSGDTLSLIASAQSASATASGVAAKAELRTNAGAPIVTGLTVGGTAEGTAGGKDIVLAASTISSGQTVQISSATIQHAA